MLITENHCAKAPRVRESGGTMADSQQYPGRYHGGLPATLQLGGNMPAMCDWTTSIFFLEFLLCPVVQVCF